MRRSWSSRALGALIRFRYRGKILAWAALAAAAPFAAIVGGRGFLGDVWPAPPEWAPQAALATSLLALLALAACLRPLGLAVRALDRRLAADDLAPSSGLDEAASLLAGVTRLADQLEAVTSRVAQRHPLTDLPTKEAFVAAVGERLAQSPPRGLMGVIRFADYDRLASFDQAAADKVLTAFAARLGSTLNASRLLAHVDRDCFAVWFGDVDDPKAASAELHAVGYVLTQELGKGDLEVNPEVSLGAAIYPRDGLTAVAVLASALAALRLENSPRSSGVAFASRRSMAAARERFGLEQKLHHAIARDQFLLHFQPVVDLDRGAVVGAEALLRWRHPELGLVPSAEFIPVLEESSLMDEVGLWVLNAACRQTRRLNEQGHETLKMAVNVSGRQLRDGNLAATIERTLARHALEPRQLEIELTETGALEDGERTRALLSDLRRLGVSVAIDDFGTGYSSLGKLKTLPFSKLKIDRQFVAGADKDRQNQAICASLVELARGLDMTVMAEGCETLEEVAIVRRLGCAMFQGFFFSRPLPAADFELLLVDAEWLAMLASPARREHAKLQKGFAA